MDPISFAIELEIGSFLIAAVGGFATWLHNRQQRALRHQREIHHRQMQAAAERRHQEQMAALRAADRPVVIER